MAKTHRFVIDVVSAESADQVFSRLADAARWKEWAGFMIATSGWDKEGDPKPGGVGAVRAVGRFPFVAREQVVVYDPPRHHAYILVKGVPNRSYRADVTLTAAPEGTEVHWVGEFVPSIPGTGHFFNAVLRLAVRNLAAHLVAAGRKA